jgi:hypothetical protein
MKNEYFLAPFWGIKGGHHYGISILQQMWLSSAANRKILQSLWCPCVEAGDAAAGTRTG